MFDFKSKRPREQGFIRTSPYVHGMTAAARRYFVVATRSGLFFREACVSGAGD